MALFKIDPGVIIWTWITFILVLIILGKSTWKTIIRGLNSRADKIQDDLKEAERTKEKAKKSLANYYNSMSEDNKLVFDNRLMVLDSTNFTYDEDYGAYYRFSDDALFKLDKSTNLYKKQS